MADAGGQGGDLTFPRVRGEVEGGPDGGHFCPREVAPPQCAPLDLADLLATVGLAPRT